MRPTQHPSNNDVLGAPAGVRIDECKALPITRVRYTNGMTGVQSYWRPSEAEKQAIAAGAAVRFSSWGNTHPPVHIGVDGIEEE